MSTVVATLRRGRPAPAVRFALFGAVALGLATLAEVAGVPVAVRTFVCLPVILGVGGVASARLFLVGRFAALDGMSRVGVAALGGLGLLLIAGLFSAVVVGGGLPADRVIGLDAGLTLVVLAAQAIRGAPGPVAVARLRPTGAAGVSLLVVALLVGVLVVGRLLVPGGAPTPTLALTGSAGLANGPIQVTAGSPLPLDLRLRHLRTAPTAATLRAVVDGHPVAVDGALTRVGDGDYAGTATVTLPDTPGVHRVVVGADLPGQRLELVTYAAVQRR